MKKITHSLVAMFALIATTAFAVDPVAVWNGDFTDPTGGGTSGWTLSTEGSSVEGGILSIGTKPISISRPATISATYFSVVMDVSNVPAAGVIATFGRQENSTIPGWNTSFGSYNNTDLMGVMLDGGKPYGVWSGAKRTNSPATQTSFPSDGQMHRVIVRFQSGANYGVTMSVDGTQIFKADSGLKATMDVMRVNVGGFYHNNASVMQGMKIQRLALFADAATDAELAAYKFPAPSKLYLYTQGTNGGWGGNCNYGNNLNGITLPATAEAPVGTKIEVTKMEIAQSPNDSTADNRPTRIAIVVGNKTTTSTDFVSGGTIAASGGNNPVKLTYNFPVGCVLTVGTQATIKWLKADGSEITGQIRYAASNDATGRFLSVNNGNGYSPIALLYGREPIALTEKTIDADKTWTALWDGSEPEADEVVALTVSGNPTLTLDKSIACDSVILLGDGNLTIVGNSSADMAKIDCGSFTGKLTFEIDASAGLTADTALKNYIRAASGKVTFVFKSTVSSKGATLDYGTANLTDGKSLGSHIVFDGGAHTFQYRCEYAGLKFGANATAENPTIRVTNNATLTFAARNLCGWTSGNADANGIIRVDNGSKLNLNPTGGTLYWAQQFYLEPGAQLTYSDGANFRINGGTNYAPQIFVPSSDTDMTATPAKIIRSGNNDFCVNGQGTKGMAISVGENSKLIIESGIALDNTNCDIIKLGGGVLAVTGNIVNQNFTVDAGIVSLCGSITMLTLNENGVLDIDNGTPTVTGSLVTATEKQLKLAITSPIHGMSVITLPDAADKTGWTAYVNDRAEPNELTVDGNTLKLKWKIPPTITIDANNITIEPTSDWNGGTVKIDVSGLNKGDYKEAGDITYRLRFGDTTVDGEVEGNSAIFTLPDTDFTAGNIYRGTFELGYGDAGDTITAADVIVYEGKLTYVEKDQWVNETSDTFKTTGSYDPESGVSVVEKMIQINTNKEVTFTPKPDPDYVDKCDSSFTIKISADEAIDDDDQTIEEDAQAGVQIVADNTTVDGVKFQFIVRDEWVNGPKAELNKLYEVTISFHYAKEEGDKDSVTYAVGEWKESYERRANTADKVTEIVFYDGTQFASLVGTCQIEKADPVAQGIKPGEVQEIIADNDVDAQKAAEKIPVMIPEDNDVKTAIGANESGYKALFKVVAVKKNGSYTAEVVFADDAIPTIKEEEDDILSKVVAALGSLVGEEGTLENIKGQPGLYYGIATDGALVKMSEATPDEWVIANGEGKIVGLKVKKTASAKQGFYKVICTPVKPATK